MELSCLWYSWACTCCELPNNQIVSNLFGHQLFSPLGILSTSNGVWPTGHSIQIARFILFNVTALKPPFWNHWHAAASFFGNMLNLGNLLVAVICVAVVIWQGTDAIALLQTLAPVMAIGITLEGIALCFHTKDMHAAEHDGVASHYIQTTSFGKTYVLRDVLITILALSSFATLNLWLLLGWSLLALSVLTSRLCWLYLRFILW